MFFRLPTAARVSASIWAKRFYSVGSPSLRGAVKLTNKSLLRVRGPDTSKFLNGLITTKVEDSGFGFYCGFLNSKGRVLADTFLYPTHYSNLFGEKDGDASASGDASYLIECDSAVAPNLLTNLRMYKLRANVDIEAIDEGELGVWHVWDDSSVTESVPLELENRDAIQPYCPQLVGTTDRRAPGFGVRLVLAGTNEPSPVLSHYFNDIPRASLAEYNVRRMYWGIPEGAKEMPYGSALPLDSCMDYMGGVDFDKGCYVGQELTIRTHHHGIVRKRIVPVQLYMKEQQEATSDAQQQLDLSYDPESLVARTMDTSLLAGASISNIGGGAIGDASQLAKVSGSPNPFGVSAAASSASKKRSSGTMISAIGNIGLALIRLDQFSNTSGEFAIQTPQGLVYVQAFIPFWWPAAEGEESM